MVNLTGCQQLAGADDSEALAQFRSEKILPAIAPSYRQIGGIIKRTVRPQRHQVRVLVIRVGCDVENASEHVQLLQSELNFSCVHWLRQCGRSRVGEER